MSTNLELSMAHLLHSGAHSDVTLVLVDDGGQELRAHKLILMARSPVFEEMFETQPMVDSIYYRFFPIVQIVETRMQVFKEALNYIYTGRVSSFDGISKDLLICADKYKLDHLKSLCEDYLISTISDESDLFDLLKLANRYTAPKLKAKVYEVMRSMRSTIMSISD